MKINLNGKQRIFIAHGETDMRLSIDGLAALVQEYFQLDPFSSDLFLFCNRGRDKVKILHWEHNGFWLYYRRLENGRFQWPEGLEGETMDIDIRQLRWLLEGLTVEEGKVHPKIDAKKVV
ncbi:MULTISPECIES: IS66 family insertion sequence element accessory protein TnpB [Allobacillus]|uniref:IS66 family insertion sequence element accessory protein TnpB n=2 Tax=Allobacillus TaxID=1400133 RepID=A0A556P6E6_9BACI|nr:MULTISPECIES: IS66 family insertion sequence element accessory protein TnpB [Allobacillus]MBU6082056.1 IS66 family insertion sequence element accessory protein TnpB [Allobacillus halotolerans]TSJ59944.1 IS66 family insertion sequence element accessory protein TnpB [Allobacillus salarius]TSJ68380.1 IS66 family insertion sequence element accessory protein TnpB [Allobacillus sp. SKP2-8]